MKLHLNVGLFSFFSRVLEGKYSFAHCLIGVNYTMFVSVFLGSECQSQQYCILVGNEDAKVHNLPFTNS